MTQLPIKLSEICFIVVKLFLAHLNTSISLQAWGSTSRAQLRRVLWGDNSPRWAAPCDVTIGKARETAPASRNLIAFHVENTNVILVIKTDLSVFLLSQCTRACGNGLGIGLPSCIVTINSPRTGLNPLIHASKRGHRATYPIHVFPIWACRWQIERDPHQRNILMFCIQNSTIINTFWATPRLVDT